MLSIHFIAFIFFLFSGLTFISRNLLGRHESLGYGPHCPSLFPLSLLIQFSTTQANSHFKYGHWIIVFNFMVPVPSYCFLQIVGVCLRLSGLWRKLVVSLQRAVPRGKCAVAVMSRRYCVPFSLPWGAPSCISSGLVVLNGYFQE